RGAAFADRDDGAFHGRARDLGGRSNAEASQTVAQALSTEHVEDARYADVRRHGQDLGRAQRAVRSPVSQHDRTVVAHAVAAVEALFGGDQVGVEGGRNREWFEGGCGDDGFAGGVVGVGEQRAGVRIEDEDGDAFGAPFAVDVTRFVFSNRLQASID